MNLNLVHQILKAAKERPDGFLKVRGAEMAREVELMTAAGLVESFGTVHGFETFAVIKRVTASGYTFLRAFRNQRSIPATATGAPQKAV